MGAGRGGAVGLSADQALLSRNLLPAAASRTGVRSPPRDKPRGQAGIAMLEPPLSGLPFPPGDFTKAALHPRVQRWQQASLRAGLGDCGHTRTTRGQRDLQVRAAVRPCKSHKPPWVLTRGTARPHVIRAERRENNPQQDKGTG